MTPSDSERDLSLSAARRAIADRFRSAGIESADLDARLLLGHALGLDHAGLIAAGNRVLSAQDMESINALVARRVQYEPVARILGRKEFWGLPLRLSAATLVPRPDTEIVVEAALAATDRHFSRTQPLRIADLGTGTGALLFALLRELPHAQGVGTDLSSAALATAQENARDLGLLDRCELMVSDFGLALPEPFDLVVSNPPYIASADIGRLPPEVRGYDPALALDGGADGLDCYRRIAEDAGRLLKAGGLIVLEIGAGQSANVTALMESAGLRADAPPRPDLAGIPRALVFRSFS